MDYDGLLNIIVMFEMLKWTGSSVYFQLSGYIQVFFISHSQFQSLMWWSYFPVVDMCAVIGQWYGIVFVLPNTLSTHTRCEILLFSSLTWNDWIWILVWRFVHTQRLLVWWTHNIVGFPKQYSHDNFCKQSLDLHLAVVVWGVFLLTMYQNNASKEYIVITFLQVML